MSMLNLDGNDPVEPVKAPRRIDNPPVSKEVRQANAADFWDSFLDGASVIVGLIGGIVAALSFTAWNIDRMNQSDDSNFKQHYKPIGAKRKESLEVSDPFEKK